MTLTETEPHAMPADLEHEMDQYRRELHVHCYRMLGSYTDAEDQVQETFIRAWRHRDDFEAGTNLRAWLYRIATNGCIDAIRASGRQAGQRAEATWLEPYPDDPETAAVARETIELAFITAVQTLPPRQRAVLVLNAALGWAPVEIARNLEMTPPAVNSALQRARATLRERLPEDRSTWNSGPLSAEERTTIRRFIDFHERGDGQAAAALLRDDIVTTMPPDPSAVRGRPAHQRLIDIAFGPNGMGTWKVVPVGVNRQPAAASYLCRPGESEFRAFKLDAFRVVDGQLAETTVFDASMFETLGLPELWSEELRGRTFAAFGLEK